MVIAISKIPSVVANRSLMAKNGDKPPMTNNGFSFLDAACLARLGTHGLHIAKGMSRPIDMDWSVYNFTMMHSMMRMELVAN